MTDQAAVSKTQSVLDQMTQSVMDSKAAAKTRLTPVGLEARPVGIVPTDVPGASFPNDNPREVVETAIREIRREVEHVLAAVAAWETMIGGEPPAIGPTPAEQQREKERAADAKVRAAKADSEAEYNAAVAADLEASVDVEKAKVLARMDRAATAAQEAVFGSTDGRWKCPVHGGAKEMISRKGRKYMACGKYPEGCPEFEKL